MAVLLEFPNGYCAAIATAAPAMFATVVAMLLLWLLLLALLLPLLVTSLNALLNSACGVGGSNVQEIIGDLVAWKYLDSKNCRFRNYVLHPLATIYA